MNKNPGAKQFWRVCGPILLYWLIEFCAQILAGVAVVAIHANELAQAVIQVSKNESSTALVQVYEGIFKTLVQHQVELAGFMALCTIPLTVCLFHADRKRERTLSIPVNKKAEPWRYIEIAALGVALNIGMNCLTFMTQLAFKDTGYQETSEMFYSASVPVQILCLGIVIPLAEELMFRGVLYKRYREQSSFFMAALYSTILFSMSHTNTTQFLYTLLLGFFLAYVYEKFGSFLAPVLLHIVANLVSVILANTGVLTWIMGKPTRLGITVVACAFVCSVMFVLIQRIDEKPDILKKQEENHKPPEMFR